MRAIRCAVAALLVAGMVAVVGAQQPRQGGGGGGGDLTTLVLSNTALQEELKVTADQKEKLKPVADKQAEYFKKAFGGGFGKGKVDKDKQAEIREEGKKLSEEVQKAVTDTLTADQKKRLKQIAVQQMGVGIFAEPVEGKGGFGGTSEAQKALMKEVAEALKLTDSQKTKLKELASDYNKDRDAIRKDIFGEKGGGFGKQDPDKAKDFASKTEKLLDGTWEKVTAALDDTQKKTWKDLTGEPFDLAKLRPMFVQPKKD
jgi:hypothetical protein